MEETFRNYSLKAAPVKTQRGKWSVCVTICRENDGKTESERFYADDGIEYILEVEAEKESINLGRNLIKNGRVRF